MKYSLKSLMRKTVLSKTLRSWVRFMRMVFGTEHFGHFRQDGGAALGNEEVGKTRRAADWP